MALTPPDDPTSAAGPPAPPDHDAALDAMRRNARQKWVLIADDVLETALRADHGSLPLRAYTSGGPVWISERVVTSTLQRALDGTLSGAAVGRIAIGADTDNVLISLTVELFGQFGHDLLELAEQARDIAITVLWETLQLDRVAVDITPLHMHYSDITYADPHQVDPADER